MIMTSKDVGWFEAEGYLLMNLARHESWACFANVLWNVWKILKGHQHIKFMQLARELIGMILSVVVVFDSLG